MLLIIVLLDSIEWLGHSGFRIDGGGWTVYIDPYRVQDGRKADAILITHGHYDHFSRQDVERLSHEGTWLIGPPELITEQLMEIQHKYPGLDLVDMRVVNESRGMSCIHELLLMNLWL